jgi:hypothetical protein
LHASLFLLLHLLLQRLHVFLRPERHPHNLVRASLEEIVELEK